MIINVIPTKLCDFTGLLGDKYGIPNRVITGVPLSKAITRRYIETFKVFQRVCNPGTEFVIHKTLRKFFK